LALVGYRAKMVDGRAKSIVLKNGVEQVHAKGQVKLIESKNEIEPDWVVGQTNLVLNEGWAKLIQAEVGMTKNLYPPGWNLWWILNGYP